MIVEYFGVRGSIPRPLSSATVLQRILSASKTGAESISVKDLKKMAKDGRLGYGGNTSCVMVSEGDFHLIIDAGTGIRGVGEQLSKLPLDQDVHILLTHLHWDHIQGLPFFAPLYQAGRTVHIYSSVSEDRIDRSLEDQWVSPYFPVPRHAIPCELKIHHFKKKTKVGPFSIESINMLHPDPTFGYKVSASGKSYAHFSDTELTMMNASKAKAYQNFLKNVDLLTADSQFDDLEAQIHTGWGHSCAKAFIDLVEGCSVKTLAMFHYNPQETEEKIDELFKAGKKHLRSTIPQGTKLICAIEGQRHKL